MLKTSDELPSCTVCSEKHDHKMSATCGKNDHFEVHKASCLKEASARRSRCEIFLADKFKLFDADGDGYIDRAELCQALWKLSTARFWTPNRMDELMALVGASKEGCIDYEAFANFVVSCGLGSEAVAVAFLEVIRSPLHKVVHPAVLPGDDVGLGPCILIFLDVDGVLNVGDSTTKTSGKDSPTCGILYDPEGRHTEGLDCLCLAVLRNLLDSFRENGHADTEDAEMRKILNTRARVVLSSTWRLHEDRMRFLGWALASSGIDNAVIVGQTAGLMLAGRSAEILHYVAECAWSGIDVSAWVAIDDNDHNLAGLNESNRVLTSDMTGLDTTAASEARNSLVHQDRSWHSARGRPQAPYPEHFSFADPTPSARSLHAAPSKPKGRSTSRTSASKAAGQHATSPKPKRRSTSRTPKQGVPAGLIASHNSTK